MTATDADSLTEKIEQALWGLTRVYDAPHGGIETGVHAPVHEVVAAVLPVVATQESDGESAVRALHRPGQVYTLSEECSDPEAHEWELVDGGGFYVCMDEPTGERFCIECRPEDALDSTEYPYPCTTIQALDSARATHCPEEGRA